MSSEAHVGRAINIRTVCGLTYLNSDALGVPGAYDACRIEHNTVLISLQTYCDYVRNAPKIAKNYLRLSAMNKAANHYPSIHDHKSALPRFFLSSFISQDERLGTIISQRLTNMSRYVIPRSLMFARPIEQGQ